MPTTHIANRDQAAHWNDQAGRTWSELGDLIDRVLAPLIPLIVDVAGRIDGRSVLDVGCGAGALSLAMADRAGAASSCLGVDISAPLIAAARARAARDGIESARFLKADAQTLSFDPQSFDAVVSRFGVMFFEDPVAAFANLHSAARPGATLACVAWRSPAENAFMTAGARAAAAVLPDFPPTQAGGPGQFGFADGRYVQAILQESGWDAIAVRPVDVPCRMSCPDLGIYMTRMGPLGALFPNLDDGTKAALLPKLEAAFAPFVQGEEVRFTSACWLITARA